MIKDTNNMTHPDILFTEANGGGGMMQDGVDDTKQEKEYEEYLSHLSEMAEDKELFKEK